MCYSLHVAVNICINCSFLHFTLKSDIPDGQLSKTCCVIAATVSTSVNRKSADLLDTRISLRLICASRQQQQISTVKLEKHYFKQELHISTYVSSNNSDDIHMCKMQMSLDDICTYVRADIIGVVHTNANII